MCVSNPDLHRFILEKVWRTGRGTLRLGQSNAVEYCQCAMCMAWDGPQPEPGDIPGFERNAYGARSVSYRYARFWKTVYEQAAERDPNVRATVLMYQTTLPGARRDRIERQHLRSVLPMVGRSYLFPHVCGRRSMVSPAVAQLESNGHEYDLASQPFAWQLYDALSQHAAGRRVLQVRLPKWFEGILFRQSSGQLGNTRTDDLRPYGSRLEP